MFWYSTPILAFNALSKWHDPRIRHSLRMVYHLRTNFKLYWLWLHHLQKEPKRVFSGLISLQVGDRILAQVTCNHSTFLTPPKGPSLYYVRVFWVFFELPTHPRKDIFSIHKVRENWHFLDHPPTPMSLRNKKMAPNGLVSINLY